MRTCRKPVVLPERVHNPDYIRPIPAEMYVPAVY